MFSKQESQVVFTPYASAAEFTDPSYHLPAFYTVWAVAANSTNGFWSLLANASRTFFTRAADPTTSLCPDYSTFEGQPTGSQQNFAFDAWRCAQNIAGDFVSRAFPSWNRSILTEIYLCHACSYHEIEGGNTRAGLAGRGGRRLDHGYGYNARACCLLARGAPAMT
jgi:hypothetical protein